MEGILQGQRSGPNASHATHTYTHVYSLCNIYPIATNLLVQWVHDHLWAAGVVALDGSGPLY